jgi:hypothetical protein
MNVDYFSIPLQPYSAWSQVCTCSCCLISRWLSGSISCNERLTMQTIFCINHVRILWECLQEVRSGISYYAHWPELFRNQFWSYSAKCELFAYNIYALAYSALIRVGTSECYAICIGLKEAWTAGNGWVVTPSMQLWFFTTWIYVCTSNGAQAWTATTGWFIYVYYSEQFPAWIHVRTSMCWNLLPATKM